jgi:hypothetical protein
VPYTVYREERARDTVEKLMKQKEEARGAIIK